MKATKARITKGLQKGSYVEACDNSGAKVLKIVSVKRAKTVKGRVAGAGIGDMFLASVVKGRPDMRKQVVFAVLVRQKKEYRRANGVRIQFEDNAAVVLKDDKGNPKGTIFKGPIAKEVNEKWPGIAKIASLVV
ncbi:50S ribosomal protein L14 [Euryarchaeota archaeon SM23-78]|nr:MAG: 50S ribosomal protein L14 [Euryarchaeota archaeon SM23-78]